MEQRGAARVREELAAQSDQTTRGDFELHAHAARTVIHHLGEFAAPAAESFHHHADERLRTIHDKALDGFETVTVFRAHHDLRLADHQLVAFAAHRFDQDCELQLAAAEHTKSIRGAGV